MYDSYRTARSGNGLTSHLDAANNSSKIDLPPIREIRTPEISTLCKGQEINFLTDLVISDNDDTVVHGTGEYVHDGHAARFAMGLSRCLMELHQQVGGILSSADIELLHSSKSIFNAERWAPYRDCTGVSEMQVLSGIAALANEDFNLESHGVEVSEQALKHHESLALEEDWDFLMNNVQVDAGSQKLFMDAKKHKIPVTICSASNFDFVRRALCHVGLSDLVDEMVCNAVKKNPDGTFSGRDVLQLCETYQVAPRNAVFKGDSLADIGSAMLAGIGLILIRVPDKRVLTPLEDMDYQSEKRRVRHHLANLSRVIETIEVPDDRTYRSTIVFVPDFARVNLVGKVGSSEGVSFSISSPRAEFPEGWYQ